VQDPVPGQAWPGKPGRAKGLLMIMDQRDQASSNVKAEGTGGRTERVKERAEEEEWERLEL